MDVDAVGSSSRHLVNPWVLVKMNVFAFVSLPPPQQIKVKKEKSSYFTEQRAKQLGEGTYKNFS